MTNEELQIDCLAEYDDGVEIQCQDENGKLLDIVGWLEPDDKYKIILKLEECKNK